MVQWKGRGSESILFESVQLRIDTEWIFNNDQVKMTLYREVWLKLHRWELRFSFSEKKNFTNNLFYVETFQYLCFLKHVQNETEMIIYHQIIYSNNSLHETFEKLIKKILTDNHYKTWIQIVWFTELISIFWTFLGACREGIVCDIKVTSTCMELKWIDLFSVHKQVAVNTRSRFR